MADVQQVIKRFEQAKKRWYRWFNIHQEAYEFALPQREIFNEPSEGTQGEERNTHLYDDTAQESVPLFASRFQSGLVPPQQDWCLFVPGSVAKMGLELEGGEEAVKEAQKLLDEQKDVFFDYVHRSNLSVQVNEALHDLCVGTMAMMCIEQDDIEKPFRFQAVPIAQLALEEGPHGEVQTVYRFWKASGRNIPQMWKITDEELLTKYNEQPDKEFEIIEATIYDVKGSPYEVKTADGIETRTRHYQYQVIDKSDKALLFEEWQNTSPWIIARYMKVAGEIYGRGPVIQQLPNIRVCNKAAEYMMKAAEWAAGRVFKASTSDGTLNPYMIDIEPNTVIPMMDTANGLQEMVYQGRPEVTMLYLEERRRSIRKAMFADRMGPAEDTKVMTAYQTSVIYNEMMQDIGGGFGRLKSEILQPLILRVVDILVRRGLMIPIVINGVDVDIKYTSPLAKAQDMKDLESTTQAIQTNMELFGPQAVMTHYNQERVMASIDEKLGVGAKLQNTKEEKEEIQDAIQQAQEAAAAQAGAGQG